MSIKIPTLSSSGWVSEVSEKADKAISYFFVSDHSQTALYPGNVSSLAYIVQQYGNDALALLSEMQRRVQTYMSHQFDEANVSVTLAAVTEPDNGQINLKLLISVKENGKEYSIGRLIKTLNSKVQEIINLNNNGDE